MVQTVRVIKIRIGDDILAYCGRCKAERTHITASLNSAHEPADVICRTCNSQHRYRPQGAQSRQTAARSSSPKSRNVDRGNSASPAANMQPVNARPYSSSESYREAEWIDHTRFGPGRVTSVRGGKIEVRFASGPRTLIHAG